MPVVEGGCFLPRPDGEVFAVIGEEQFGEESFWDVSFPIPEGGTTKGHGQFQVELGQGCNPGGPPGPPSPALTAVG